MRISLTALVKMLGFLTIVACIVAVGLARLEPVPARFRLKAPAIYSLINSFVINSTSTEPSFLDTSTGRVRSLKLPKGQRLDYAACSPWVDDRGEYQIVGRWAQHTLGGDTFQVERFGMARYAMPSGRLISKSNVEVVPASHPCWYPGNVSKVLYAGGDGKLYSVDFNDAEHNREFGSGAVGDEPDDFDTDTDVTVTPIRWKCEPPGTRLMIMDPVWNDDPRLRHRLIVSLSYWNNRQQTQLTPSHLWWLELNAEGNEIVKAAPLNPLYSSEMPTAKTGEERHPNLAVSDSGEIMLAYLWQRYQEFGHWELRLTTLNFDAQTNEPAVDPNGSSTKVLSLAHLGDVPQFSVDGRWIYGIVQNELNGESLADAAYPLRTSSRFKMGCQGRIMRFSSKLHDEDADGSSTGHTLARLGTIPTP